MKLSIITINLNNRGGLRKTIESVVSQTFTDFEYIVIDGASTDGSVDIIKEHGDRIAYWVSEPDKGIYNAMNKGILQAKGDYCQFLNSGDILYSTDALESIFNGTQLSDSPGIISGNMLKEFPDGEIIEDKGLAYAKIKQNRSLSLADMVKGTINHPSTFIRRELFNKYGLYREDYRIVSDWIFFLITIGLNDVKVTYTDFVIAVFSMTGISSTNPELLKQERVRALKEYLPESILDDYKYLLPIEEKYKWMFKYKFTYQVARVLNITIRFFDRKIF